MSHKHSALALALCAALAACAGDKSTAPAGGSGSGAPLPSVSRVVVISIDGLRGDALQRMPSLGALRTRAAWTDSMLTVAPSLTVPGHISMFTGRDVTQIGITTNTLDASAGLSLALSGATSMFQWVHASGGHSTALVGTQLVPASDLEQARQFFGIDEVVSVDTDLATLRDEALAVAARADAPTLLFIHVPTVDFAGHDFGWIRTDTALADGGDVLGVRYVEAVHAADEVVSALWTALQPAVDRGEVALIVTADHGGGHGEGCTPGIVASREHCTRQAGDRIIPFVLLARDARSGRIAGQPTIMQVAPTVATMLRLTAPSSVGRPLRL
jgi:predicted AlkP superfamily pyrophosphatase or phosphodiesterase